MKPEYISMIQELIDEAKVLNRFSMTSYDFRDFEDAISDALEMEVPKKPLHIHRNYYCPVCQEGGWIMWDDAVPNKMDNYCGICGQAIDWEEIA